MKYQEIYDEYTNLLQSHSQMRFEMADLPMGNIVKKRISGKEYHYLQYSAYGKKKTEYLKASEVPEVLSRLERRKTLIQQLEMIQTELDRIEKAVKILDHKLSSTFVYLRQCADMDAMPLSKRPQALSFAAAMTALEGLPARDETEHNLLAWARGEKAFAEFYLPTLQYYRVMEGAS